MTRVSNYLVEDSNGNSTSVDKKRLLQSYSRLITLGAPQIFTERMDKFERDDNKRCISGSTADSTADSTAGSTAGATARGVCSVKLRRNFEQRIENQMSLVTKIKRQPLIFFR